MKKWIGLYLFIFVSVLLIGVVRPCRAVSSDNASRCFKRLSSGTQKRLQEPHRYGRLSKSNSSDVRVRLFDDGGHILSRYKSQVGYAQYAKDFHGGELKDAAMAYAFSSVSAALSPEQMAELSWKRYDGSPKSFYQERSQIFDETGEVKNEYIGFLGYYHYAMTYYGGPDALSAMSRAASNVSAVLNPDEMSRLRWKTYLGSPRQYLEERQRLFTDATENVIRPEIKGQEGYVNYTSLYYNGSEKASSMKRAFSNVSAVLSDSEFADLGWKAYKGRSVDLEVERQRFFDKSGKLKNRYRRQVGYIQYALDFYRDDEGHADLLRPFQNVSAVLGKELFKELGWQLYSGSETAYKVERSRFVDASTGQIGDRYRGRSGYLRYTIEFYGGENVPSSMGRAFQNVSAVLSKEGFELLEWQYYNGTPFQYKLDLDRLRDEDGQIRKEYFNEDGYALFASEFYGGLNDPGAMFRAFKNISAVLPKADFKRLGWTAFRGSPSRLLEIRKQALDDQGQPRIQYMGDSGLEELMMHFCSTDDQKLKSETRRQIQVALGGGVVVRKMFGW